MPLKLNSTGGGSITLDTPSTGGAFTLTVPASTSTLATTNGTLTNPTINGFTGDTSVINVGTGQFYKDASGNIGVGNATPSTYGKLAVATPTAGYGVLSVNNSAGGGGGGQLSYYYGTAKIAYFDCNLSNGTPGSETASLSFATANSGAIAERARIDSAGRFTIPYQPIFMGAPTNNYSSGGMPTGVIPFTSISNNGSCYNAATSRFTAPIAGWYRVTWGGLQLASTVTSLQVNGSDVHNGNHFATGTANAPNYVNMTQTAIQYLNANDYLTIRGWNGGGYYNTWYLWTVHLIA